MAVKDLEKILEKYLPKGSKIENTRFTNLVAPGENYGGELLKLEITTINEKTQEKNIFDIVAKKIPATEALQIDFNIQVTYKAEILFYEKIVPILQNFQRENGINDVIDCFVKFFGGRINLNESDVVDKDGVILMENLITSGYRNLDRHIGYNLEETRMVLKDLADLQSTVVALKLRKPDFFQREIRPLCNNTLGKPEDNRFLKVILVIRDILLESNEVAPFVPKVMEIWNKFGGKFDEYDVREPFATLSHCDLWVNNAMMKYENEKPKKNIFLDFQLYSYKSPVLDLLNFLLTSVQTDIIRGEFDNLIKFYHSEFISNLERLGCETEPFVFSKFEEELIIDGGKALSWAILFIPLVVFGKKQKVEENQEIKQMDFMSDEFANSIRLMMPECKERLYFMVETLGKRGWLGG